MKWEHERSMEASRLDWLWSLRIPQRSKINDCRDKIKDHLLFRVSLCLHNSFHPGSSGNSWTLEWIFRSGGKERLILLLFSSLLLSLDRSIFLVSILSRENEQEQYRSCLSEIFTIIIRKGRRVTNLGIIDNSILILFQLSFEKRIDSFLPHSPESFRSLLVLKHGIGLKCRIYSEIKDQSLPFSVSHSSE